MKQYVYYRIKRNIYYNIRYADGLFHFKICRSFMLYETNAGRDWMKWDPVLIKTLKTMGDNS